MSKFTNKAALLLAAACFSTIPALAQSTTQGAIAGTVFDSTTAAIPSATITIHSDGTNAEQTLTSDGSGYFKAPQLAPGTYTVTVKANGFKEVRTTQVIVQVNSVTQIDPILSNGASSEIVEVTADVPVLKFDTPSYGGQLSNAEIENIPINNRRWSSLALLTPGVTNDASGFGLISFRAIASTLNNVQIDGVDDNQAFYGEERGRTRAGYSTSQIAIREFQVLSGVYSTEFGRATGGVINSVTKSGTNTLHGELYFYHRDQQWSASNPYVRVVKYDPASAVASNLPFKAKDKRNQFGFGVGGPLIKDKLFGFYSFDQFRRVFPGTAVAGNASFYADPTAADLTTFTARQTASTGTTVTSTQALTTYRNYISILNGDLGSVPRLGFQTINTPKIDWQINSKNTFSVLYHRLRWDSPGGVQTQQSNNYAVDSFGTDFVKLDYGFAKLNSIITSKIVNEARYAYGRELNNEGRQTPSAVTNQYFTPQTGLFPNVPVQVNNASNAFTMGTPYYSFRYALPDERKWQIGDTASILIGNHNVKAGVDILHNYDLQNALGFSTYPGNGAYNYGTILALVSDLAAPSKGGCGTATAGVYTPVGCYTNFRYSASSSSPTTGAPFQSIFDMATIDYGFFLQDDWKATPRLTINFGVRYDYQKFPQTFAALVNTAFPNAQNTPSDKNNFGPRVGFAYDPFGKGKSVLRGGFGMYYGHIPNTAILSSRFYTGLPAGQLSYTVTPTSTSPLLPGRQTTVPSVVPDIQYMDQHLQNPMTEQFDLAYQQNLGLNTVLSLTYLGSLGRELPNSLNLNIDPSASYTVAYTVTPATTGGTCGPIACGTVINQKVYGQKKVTVASPLTSVASTLNTNYGSTYAGISNINSSYHAATVELQRRASKYISFDANYTWSHAHDYNQSAITGFSSNNWFDPYANARSNYGNSYLDIRHRAVAWAILNSPTFGGPQSLKQVINGWSIKPALQIQSGLPYSAAVNTSNPTSQCAAVGCYQANASGLAGTGVSYIPQLGRNTYNYPRDINVDLRIQKDFKLPREFNLQIVGEAFNVANHQNVTSINTTAYNLTAGATPATNATTPTATLVYQPTSFGVVQNSNNNFAYGPRTVQAGARLFF